MQTGSGIAFQPAAAPAVEAAIAGGPRFEALDSLRGVAALMVVLFHARISNHLSDLSVVRAGEMFVDFFFVLSGFVIAHAYGQRIAGRRDLGRFLVLRVGRILPLHLALLAIFVAFECAKVLVPQLGAAGDEPFTGSNAPWTIPTNLALLHSIGIHDTLSWNTPSWSISAEAIAYFCFGVTALVMMKRMWLAALVSIVASCAVLWALSPSGMESTHDFGAVRALFGFATGVVLHHFGIGAILDSRSRLARVDAATRLRWTLVELLALALAIGFVAFCYRGTMAFAAPLLFATVLFVFAHEGGHVSRLLRLPPLLLIGTLSYSIYMVHMLILMRVVNVARLGDRLAGTSFVTSIGHDSAGIDLGNAYAGDALLAAVLVVIVAVSFITYRLVEEPGRNWFRALAERMFGKPARHRNEVTATAVPGRAT